MGGLLLRCSYVVMDTACETGSRQEGSGSNVLSCPNALLCRMLTAVAHNYLFSVKTEDLSDTLPSVTDIQLAYNKFKHFFLIGQWDSQ